MSNSTPSYGADATQIVNMSFFLGTTSTITHLLRAYEENKLSDVKKKHARLNGILTFGPSSVPGFFFWPKRGLVKQTCSHIKTL